MPGAVRRTPPGPPAARARSGGLGACDSEREREPTRATGRLGQVHAGVCAAVQLSEAGDRKRADDAFDDGHFGLHDLVQAVEQEDRAGAARLLEAIERTKAQGSTESLEILTARVAESIERMGGTAPRTYP